MNSIITPEKLRLQQLVAEQWQRPLTLTICSNISKHLIQYSEIENDNKNLIWLFTLLLQDEVELPRGEVISAMKQRVLAEDERLCEFVSNVTQFNDGEWVSI